MRTSEERIGELHRRMETMERKRTRRRDLSFSAAAFAVCLALALTLALAVASTPIQAQDDGTGKAAASIFADHGALGYVVVAMVAFCLGAVVTVFCYRLKKKNKQQTKGESKQ